MNLIYKVFHILSVILFSKVRKTIS